MEQIVSPENRRHYHGLDGLRALAVMMVMVQHYVTLPLSATWGWTGVHIFFVLSGFLITGILYDTRDAQHRWSVFYARRALRIFPLYYAVLGAALLAYPIFRWQLHPSYWLWPLYFQNMARFFWPSAMPGGPIDHLYATHATRYLFRLRYGHFWSLAVEEQFYLLWPALVFAVRSRERLMKICLVVVIVSPLIRLACSLALSPLLMQLGFLERFSLLQFDSLLLGAYFALWLRGPHPDLTQIGARLLGVLLILVVLLEIYSRWALHHFLLPTLDQPIFGSVGLSCVNLASIGLVLLAIDAGTAFSRLLHLAPLRYLGRISYGFYVFHDLLHDLYDRPIHHWHVPDPRGAATAVLAFGCTLALASLSFYGFERPFLRLKERFTIPRRQLGTQIPG